MVETSPKGEEKKQLKARGYADKYRGLRQPFHLIAVEFSKSTRNLFTLEVERT